MMIEKVYDPTIDTKVPAHRRPMFVPATTFFPSRGKPANPTPYFLGPLLTAEEMTDPKYTDTLPIYDPEQSCPLATLDSVPVCHFTKPPLDGVFCNVKSSPEFDDWYTRVDKAKRAFWINSGYYDLLYLTTRPLSLDEGMLGAACYFWCRRTNCFHFRYGMMTPTLLDVAALTSLRPDGEILTIESKPKHPFAFGTRPSSFAAYILSRRKAYPDGTAVSDAEHVEFLTLWLSCFVFCLPSRRVSKKLVPLATILHEGRHVALGQLLLAKLYQMLGNVVDTIRAHKAILSNVGGPSWLLQLWLNAVFMNSLRIPDRSICPHTLNYGCVMANFTVPQSKHQSSFHVFLFLFNSLDSSSHDIHFSPFISRDKGPEWFKISYPGTNSAERKLNAVVWRHYLGQRLLFSGFPGSTHREDKEIFCYYPNFVARQFGLCQGLPAPMMSKPSCEFVRGFLTDFLDPWEDTLQRFLERNERSLESFALTAFTPCFFPSVGFEEWWGTYLQIYHVDDAILLDRLNSDPPADNLKPDLSKEKAVSQTQSVKRPRECHNIPASSRNLQTKVARTSEASGVASAKVKVDSKEKGPLTVEVDNLPSSFEGVYLDTPQAIPSDDEDDADPYQLVPRSRNQPSSTTLVGTVGLFKSSVLKPSAASVKAPVSVASTKRVSFDVEVEEAILSHEQDLASSEHVTPSVEPPSCIMVPGTSHQVDGFAESLPSSKPSLHPLDAVVNTSPLSMLRKLMDQPIEEAPLEPSLSTEDDSTFIRSLSLLRNIVARPFDQLVVDPSTVDQVFFAVNSLLSQTLSADLYPKITQIKRFLDNWVEKSPSFLKSIKDYEEASAVRQDLNGKIQDMSRRRIDLASDLDDKVKLLEEKENQAEKLNQELLRLREECSQLRQHVNNSKELQERLRVDAATLVTPYQDVLERLRTLRRDHQAGLRSKDNFVKEWLSFDRLLE